MKLVLTANNQNYAFLDPGSNFEYFKYPENSICLDSPDFCQTFSIRLNKYTMPACFLAFAWFLLILCSGSKTFLADICTPYFYQISIRVIECPLYNFSNPLLCLLVFYNEPTPVEKGARDLNEDLTKGFELGKYSKYPRARQIFRRITNYIIN